MKVLLEKGADLTIQDTWYQTPLMYCMLTQYEEIAELLLQHDPDIVDIGDKYGKCALHIAVDVGSVECVKVDNIFKTVFNYLVSIYFKKIEAKFFYRNFIFRHLHILVNCIFFYSCASSSSHDSCQISVYGNAA